MMASDLMTGAGFLAIGFATGLVHYAGLRWNIRFYTAAGNPAWPVGLHLLRLAVTAGALILIARVGAPALLAATAGFVLARPLVTRQRSGG